MQIEVKEVPSVASIPVIWYGDDWASIERAAVWRDHLLFGDEL